MSKIQSLLPLHWKAIAQVNEQVRKASCQADKAEVAAKESKQDYLAKQEKYLKAVLETDSVIEKLASMLYPQGSGAYSPASMAGDHVKFMHTSPDYEKKAM